MSSYWKMEWYQSKDLMLYWLVNPYLCGGMRADYVQSRREGSRFRTLMAAQLLLEQSGDKRRESAAESRDKQRIDLLETSPA